MIIEYAGIYRKAKNPCKKNPEFRVIHVHAQETNTYARVNLYEMSTNKSCWRWSDSPPVVVCVFQLVSMVKLVRSAFQLMRLVMTSGEWVIFPCDNLKYHIQFHEQMDNWHLISDTKNLLAKLSWGGPFQVVWLVRVGQITSARERLQGITHIRPSQK